MAKDNPRPVADIVLSVIVIVAAIAIYAESTKLPPAYWEPLGSAAIPQVLCLLMSLLAVVILIRAIRTLRRLQVAEAAPTDSSDPVEFQRRPMAAALMMVLFAAYIALMNFGVLGFVEATFLFLVSVCLLLTKAAKAHIPWIILFAAVLAVGNYYIFTKFLYIDLPTTTWL